MNKIIKKFLLTGDKFMPEYHLKQPGFNYSDCGPFTKHRERIQKFREAGNLIHLHRNKLDKAEMGSLSSKNKNVKYLLCIIDVFIKYASVKPLKDKER